MICNCCYILTDNGYGCDDCGEVCCQDCLTTVYLNFSYYDGGVDVESRCARCWGFEPHTWLDAYAKANFERVFHIRIPHFGDTPGRSLYFVVIGLFWYRYPVVRELPQYSQSKNDAFLEKYALPRVFFAEQLCGVSVTALEKGMIVCY